jgi:hypothetical protein
MQHGSIIVFVTVGLFYSAQSWNVLESLPGLESKAFVALSASSFVASPETQWPNANNTRFYPMLGTAPWLNDANGDLPASVRFNGSQCLGNDLNSTHSIPIMSDFTFMAVFSAPAQGNHILFAQQSSPTEGYVVTFGRDSSNVWISLYINGNRAETSQAQAARWPIESRMIVLVNLRPQSQGLTMQIEFFGLGSGGTYAIPTFSTTDKKTLVGCNIDGTGHATMNLFNMIVSSSFSWAEERFVYALLMINHGLDAMLINPSFTNTEFKANVTGIEGAFLLCRSAELVLSANSSASLLVGHAINSTLDMTPFEANVSRSSRVWFTTNAAPLSVSFDRELYERAEIDWNDITLDFKHLLLYSATREYNWTVVATADANDGKPATFDTMILQSGYITYAVAFTASNRTIEEPLALPVSEPISEPASESVPQAAAPVTPSLTTSSGSTILVSILGSVVSVLTMFLY